MITQKQIDSRDDLIQRFKDLRCIGRTFKDAELTHYIQAIVDADKEAAEMEAQNDDTKRDQYMECQY